MEVKWRKAFIEVTLRAFRRLHVDYGMWGLGQTSNKVMQFEHLNEGPSVELALETAICSAISQEFISSPLTNGAYIEPSDKKERRYEIHREIRLGKELRRIDLVINRFKRESKIYFYKYPVIIEAKRAHYFKPDIATGKRGAKQKRIKDLRNDVKKLRQFRIDITNKKSNLSIDGYDNKIKDAFLYLLFWGVAKEGIKDWQKTPTNIAKEIDKDILKKDNFELRWMPLYWDKTPQTKEWLWIMLVEIDPLKAPDLSKKNWFTKN